MAAEGPLAGSWAADADGWATDADGWAADADGWAADGSWQGRRWLMAGPQMADGWAWLAG